MVDRIPPNLQQAQAATLKAANAVSGRLTMEQYDRMTDGTVSVYDVFVAQKLITKFQDDGTPDPSDPAYKLWQAVLDQFSAESIGARLKEGLKDDLANTAAGVSNLWDAASSAISDKWNDLFNK